MSISNDNTTYTTSCPAGHGKPQASRDYTHRSRNFALFTKLCTLAIAAAAIVSLPGCLAVAAGAGGYVAGSSMADDD